MPSCFSTTTATTTTAWLPSIRVLDDGELEWTTKGHAALKELFKKLDSDASHGLNYDEMRAYFSLSEGIDLVKEDFERLGLTGPTGEVDLTGFAQVYLVEFQHDLQAGEERFRSDLALLGLDKILKAQDATMLLMSKVGSAAAATMLQAAKSTKSGAAAKKPASGGLVQKQLVLASPSPSPPPLHVIAPPPSTPSTTVDLTDSIDMPSPILKKKLVLKLASNATSSLVSIRLPSAAAAVDTSAQTIKINPFFASVAAKSKAATTRVSSLTSGGDLFSDAAFSPKKTWNTLDYPILTRDASVVSVQSKFPRKQQPTDREVIDVDATRPDVHLIPRFEEKLRIAQAFLCMMMENPASSLFCDDVVMLDDDSRSSTPLAAAAAPAAAPAAVVDKRSLVEKYRPQSTQEIVSNESSVRALSEYLSQWLAERSRTDSEYSADSDTDVIPEDGDEFVEEKRTLILCGPIASGKTTAVHVCGTELGFRVVEINAGEDRSKLKASVGEASQSYGISKQARETVLQVPLILVDEFDSAFLDDPNFVASMRGVIKSARCPVVFVCDDDLPFQIASNRRIVDGALGFNPDVIRFYRPDPMAVVKRLMHIMEIEGTPMSENNAMVLATKYKGDLRACLNELAFWGDVEKKIGGKMTAAANENDELRFFQKKNAIVVPDGLSFASVCLSRFAISSISPNRTKNFEELLAVHGAGFPCDARYQVRTLIDGMVCEDTRVGSENVIKTRLIRGSNAVLFARDDEKPKRRKIVLDDEDTVFVSEVGVQIEEAAEYPAAVVPISAPTDDSDEIEEDELGDSDDDVFVSEKYAKVKKRKFSDLFSPESTIRNNKRIRADVIVETTVLVRVNSDAYVYVMQKSDENIERRHNSLMWWSLEPSQPRVALPNRGMIYPCLKHEVVITPILELQVNVATAHANVKALDRLSKLCDEATFADCVSLVRRSSLIRNENLDRCWDEFSAADELGEQLANAIAPERFAGSRLDWLSLNKRAYVTECRDLNLCLHSQRRDAFQCDIPMYAHMTRLDERNRLAAAASSSSSLPSAETTNDRRLTRSTAGGNRRFVSYFASRNNELGWVEVQRMAKLGLNLVGGNDDDSS